MSEATDWRDDLTNEITELGSTVVITPRTPTKGNYGGYEPGSDGEGTAVTTLALPSRYLISKTGNSFGKLKEGEVAIVIKGTETIDKDDKVTWNGSNYTVRDIRRPILQDVVLGIVVKLSRRLD